MSDRTESACAYIFILLLQVSAFKPKTVLVWMTHFMITLPLALNQMRLREAMRDIQDHPADGWTNPYVNNGPLILNATRFPSSQARSIPS